ncbi:hypothetical protein J1614_001013 [Plenodomus biglobosus]|nr:hypothetical protein J1614_001013 [Plenodomus biglobosus]
MAGDLVAGIKEAERLEAERRNSEERIPMVVIGHSAGGGLAQYVLSRGLVTCQGLCLLAAVPGFGSYSCYTFWLPTAPLHFVYRLFHPRYLLATTQQVQDAFFTPSTPISVVTALHNLLSPYESMCWPIQALNAFVTGPDVLQRITGWTNVRRPSERPTPSTLTASGITPRLFILAAEHDVLCKPAVLLNTARQYRSAFRWCLKMGKLDCRSSSDTGCGDDENGDGVRFKVVEGVAHHLQNHVEWERGVDELWKWTEIL